MAPGVEKWAEELRAGDVEHVPPTLRQAHLPVCGRGAA